MRKMQNDIEKEILETYNWIKTKKYNDDITLSWEERYKKLEKHHIEETSFLIEKVRDIRFIPFESLRVETRDIGLIMGSFSQGHCNIYNDDKIIYTNECTVMNVIINLYKKELRVDKLDSLLKD